MKCQKSKIIKVDGSDISLLSAGGEDYISLTDMAKSQMQEAILIKWLSLKSTIEYIGEWKRFITRSLIISNSVQLKMQQAVIILSYR